MLRPPKFALFVAVISIGSFIAPVQGAIASPPVTNGLAVSLDSRGGSTISGTTWFGQDGTSLNATLQNSSQYDSGNQYITMNDSTAPNYASLGKGTNGDAINKAGDLTVEIWAKINNVHAMGWNILATKWFTGPSTNNGCANQTFHFGLLNTKLNVYTTGVGGQNINGTTSITSGTWHQFAFTMVNPSNRSGSSVDTNGTLRVYLDGVQQVMVTGSTVYQTSDNGCELILGDGRSSGLLGIDGGMEKFRLYNRALTADEINKNYRADANIHSLAASPYNTIAPMVSGPAIYNAPETGTAGTWLNSPTSWAYQWSRATTAGGTYSAIGSATALTYITTSSDVGKYLKFTVAATNSSGTFYETSTATSIVTKASVPLSFSLSNPLPIYRTLNNLTISTSGIAGSVTFRADSKQIPGCRNVAANAGNSYIATCPWRPSVHKPFVLTAVFTPVDSNYLGDSKILNSVHVAPRSGKR